MEQDNHHFKSVYVLNLDAQRMAIVGGVLLIICGGFFYLGSRFGSGLNARNSQAMSQQINQAENLMLNEVISAKPRLTERDILPPIKAQQPVKPVVAAPMKKAPVAPPTPRADAILPVQKDPIVQGPPAKRKVARKPTAAKPASGAAVYTIQVAAFVRERDALALSEKLRTNGITARVDRGKRFFFVRVGKSANRGKLKSRMSEIAKKVQLQPILVKKTVS